MTYTCLRLGVAVIIVVSLAGCGSKSNMPLTEKPQVARVSISPETVFVRQGERQQFFSCVRDADGRIIPVKTDWSVSGNIGTINSQGIFRAEKQGSGLVVGTAGGISHTTSITVSGYQTPLFQGSSSNLPEIIVHGIEDEIVYTSPVEIMVEPAPDTAYIAYIDGKSISPYTTFSEPGRHTLLVHAVSLKNNLRRTASLGFSIDPGPPDIPVVKGVVAGSTYTKPVSIDVVSQPGVYFSALLNGKPYVFGTPVEEPGEHVISVTATKRMTGLQRSLDIRFAIDPRPPSAPFVYGVVSGGRYPAVIPRIITASGVEYSATIDEQPFSLGKMYKEKGEHTLVVTAHKKTNRLTRSRTIRFSIDRALPPEPDIHGVTDNGTYASVSIDATRKKGFSYSAAIDGIPYELGSTYTDAGSHLLAVTAVRARDEARSTAYLRFTIDPYPPATPLITGVFQNGRFSETVIGVIENEGVSYNARIDDEPYVLGDVYREPGEHIVSVTAIKACTGASTTSTISFAIDPLPPEAPEISGVTTGATYRSVVIDVRRREGVHYAAYIDETPYQTGTLYEEEGIHELCVNAVKTDTGLGTCKKILFAIDRQPPDKPVIKGISGDAVYPGPVVIDVIRKKGILYRAEVDGQEVKLGAEYAKNGHHTLVVRAQKESNNLSSFVAVPFTIDSAAPQKPVIQGVQDGSSYPGPVVIYVESREGEIYEARIDEQEYLLGTPYGKNGTHRLTVFARKQSNGMSSSSNITFSIDTLPPKPPVLLGIEDNGTYQAVQINIQKEKSVRYRAWIDNRPYRLGSEYTINGTHQLVVRAFKVSNRLSSTVTVNFTISGASDPYSETSGVHGEGQRPESLELANVEDSIRHPELQAPSVQGVEPGARYHEPVTIRAQHSGNVLLTATIDGQKYDLGTKYMIHGEHALVVTATDSDSGRSSAVSMNFGLVMPLPPIPDVDGVAPGRIYREIRVTVKPEEGVVHSAQIDGKPYRLGTTYAENGNHELVVMARDPATMAEVSNTIAFDIDNVPPDSPVLSGIERGGVYAGEINVQVKDVPGVSFSALIDGTWYKLGTPYHRKGFHTLLVTARKHSNGLTTSVVATFEIR